MGFGFGFSAGHTRTPSTLNPECLSRRIPRLEWREPLADSGQLAIAQERPQERDQERSGGAESWKVPNLTPAFLINFGDIARLVARNGS